MDSSVPADTTTVVDLLSTSFGPILGMLSRPVVLWQIVVIASILLVSWLVPRAAKRRWKRPDPGQETSGSGRRWRRWLIGITEIMTPVLALALLYAASWYFRSLGYPYRLFETARSFIWLWLLYRVIGSVLYARYGDASNPYRRRLLTPVFIALVLWQALSVLPWVSEIWETAFGIGGVSVELGSVFKAAAVLYLFLVGAWILEQVLNRTLPGRLHAEPNVVASVALLARYAVSAVGIVACLGALGFDSSSLAIVAGGLSVGIGIGLQDIVSNFISGLILLAEQSLRPGDIIEVDGRLGTVKSISLRATTILTMNNVEKVIPNNAFTTGEVTTLTKTAPLVRVLLPVGVSYESDPHQVREILEGTAGRCPMVLPEPAPLLFFRGYGDSSLSFELAAWINRPDSMAAVKSELYYMIWDALDANGIEIPFPQRDLHLRSGWDSLSNANGDNIGTGDVSDSADDAAP